MKKLPGPNWIKCVASLVAPSLVSLSLVAEVAAGTYVQFRTLAGDIEVELLDDKPVTRQNFLNYVQRGAYENMFFHRCIPGFVVQGGGFAAANRADTNYFTTFYSVTNYGPITNEFSVGNRVSNTYGTIAMAKTAEGPNTATSQWFFNLADNSANLDNQNGGFTVFGKVVRGTNVLEFFNTLNKALAHGIVDLTWWFPSNPSAAIFSDLPVNYDGFIYPRYSDLAFVDISLLNVQVRLGANLEREISWNSVAGKTNRVEFTTNMPPVWNLLIATNGNGTPLKVMDASTNAVRRFYRVRVDF